MFIAALFTIARTQKQPKRPSTEEWIKKIWYIHTMEYYSAMKRNTFESVLMRWVNLECIIQSEVSQKEKNKYCILMHICGIQKNGNDDLICKAKAVENKCMGAKEERGVVGGNGRLGLTCMHTLPIRCIKQVTKENLLHSTGNASAVLT